MTKSQFVILTFNSKIAKTHSSNLDTQKNFTYPKSKLQFIHLSVFMRIQYYNTIIQQYNIEEYGIS